MPLIKDLIQDWDAFLWNKIDATKPWLEPNGSAGGEEQTVPDTVMAKVRKAMSCFTAACAMRVVQCYRWTSLSWAQRH